MCNTEPLRSVGKLQEDSIVPGEDQKVVQDCPLSRDKNSRGNCDKLLAELELDSEFGANHCDDLQSVDSRSIITNKSRLKRFWETRIEMEFKLKQEQQLGRNEALADGGKDLPGKKILATEELDSNNNFETNMQDENGGNSNSFVTSTEVDERQAEAGSFGGSEPFEMIKDEEIAKKEVESREPVLFSLSSASGDHADEEVPNLENKEEPVDFGDSADGIQPLSIDPTLCHVKAGSKHLEPSDNLLLEAGALEQLEEDYCEEQSTNEDFGSSNSSFGPMSVSTVARISSIEDEQGSARSGSVVTVINANSSNRHTEELEGEQSNSVEILESGGQEESGSNIGVAFESLQFDDEIKSSKSELVDEVRLLHVPKFSVGNKFRQQQQQQQQHQQQQAASVQKSFGGAEAAESDGTRIRSIGEFSSQETKSVSDFIRNAISDATRQVENLMKSSSCSSLNRKMEQDCDESKRAATVVASSPEARAAALKFKQWDQEQQQQQQQRHLQHKLQSPRPNLAHRQPNDDCCCSNGGSTKSLYSSKLIIQHAKFVRRNCKIAANHQADSEREATAGAQAEGTKQQQQQADSKVGLLSNQTESDIGHVPHLGERGGGTKANESNKLPEREFNGFPEGEQSVPSTDLSSIFVANVRREIERFESNTSTIRRQQLDKSSNDKVSSLTEWRIAEEIRSFNEREKELKQRTGGYRDEQRAETRRDQQHESIVRFGKTFWIPKLTGAHVVALVSGSVLAQGAANGQQAKKLPN